MDESVRISKYTRIKVHVNPGLALNNSALHAGYNVTSKLILHGEHASKMPLGGKILSSSAILCRLEFIQSLQNLLVKETLLDAQFSISGLSGCQAVTFSCQVDMVS